MAPRVCLSLAIHNHQPVGNFPHVFEAAYSQSYLPMLQALHRHPRMRVAMHYSGPILDWARGAHPEFFPMLRALVDRGQVELLTGGYYEPILPILPERDRAGQIRKMTTVLQRRFGARPRGLWLAERVWEPHLATSIAAAGVEYTVVDDRHFLAAGLREEDLTGYFVTEDEGLTLKVFPSLHALRYLIPWKPVAEVIAFLREHAAESRPLLLMGDDGEKFGLWPGTYAHCWEAGWIEQFFAALEAEAAWLEVLPAGEAADRAAAGRVYLPTATYDEMEEWALPAATGVAYGEIRARMEQTGDPALRFLHGGFWRQFLVKYPEINTMHKKMLRVSEKVWRLPAGRRRQRALDELWQGQCNCPYWHGVFGGVYLPHIRAANFAHLITAEALADGAGADGYTAAPSTSVADLDADGMAEIEVASPAMVLWIDPAEGGGVVEWDWRAAAVNLVNVLTRRREAYHQQLLDVPSQAAPSSGDVETIHTTRVRVKESGLERLLTYDRYRRASFLDHLLPADVSAEAPWDGRPEDDVLVSPYEATPSRGRAHAVVTLVYEGALTFGGAETRLRVEKHFHVGAQGQLHISYRLTNVGSSVLRARFGVETNWAITDPHAPVVIDGAGEPAQSKVVGEGLRLQFQDTGWPAPVVLTFPRATVWREPLLTVSNSEAGFERTFQGVTCLCTWPLHLDPFETYECALECALPASGM